MTTPRTPTALAAALAERILVPDFEVEVNEKHPGLYQGLIAAIAEEYNLQPAGADLEGLCDQCQTLAFEYDNDRTLEQRANALAAYHLGRAVGWREAHDDAHRR